MKSRIFRCGIIGLAVMLMLSVSALATFNPADYEGARWVPGRIIIEFDDVYGVMVPQASSDGVVQFGIPTIDELNQQYGVHSVRDILQGLILNHVNYLPDLSRTFVFDLSPSADIMEVCRKYNELPGVHYAEPDLMRQVDVVPNDPMYGSQWALPLIGAPEAWDITRGSREVLITCLDIGVDWDHEDLIGNIWANPGEDLDQDEWVGYGFPGIVGDIDDINGIDDDQNGKIDDFYGWDFINGVPQQAYPGEDWLTEDNDPSELGVSPHGTHTTGLTIATTNNGIGIAGVNWNARIMANRVGYIANDMNGYMVNSAIVPAIYYAINNGADIISMSYGSPAQSQSENTALQTAWANGLALFGSAGNDNNQGLRYPACYPNVISVAATDNQDHKASYSSYGTWVDISAPGGDFSPGMLSTLPGNQYGEESGTSMASPQCAGAAGLVWAAFPDSSNAFITEALMDYSYDIDPLNPTYAGLLGAGRVDLVILFSHFFPRLTIYENPFVNDASGNNDGRADPVETVQLIITLENDGDWQSATNVQAILRCPGDSHIIITDSTSTYGSIPAGFQVNNGSSPFAFTVSSSLSHPYWANFQLALTSTNHGYSTTMDFQLRIGRPDLLLVDDDGGSSYDNFYEADLSSIAYHDVWDVHNSAEISGIELNRYEYVIWICGNDSTGHTLSSTDQSNIQGFLDSDGNLLLIGQNIDEDISGTPFYSNVLHAQHVAGNGYTRLDGVAGNSISDSASLMLIGGCGPGNGGRSPSKINAINGAEVIYTYENVGGNGGIRYDSGSWKVVYLAFALEAACPYNSPPIPPPATVARTVVLRRVLEWFGMTIDVPEEPESSLPKAFALEGNYPNPFNPSTNIAFLLPVESRVSLKVYNVLGQEVSTVIQDQSFSPGRHVVSFDGENLASGIYFYRVEANRNNLVGKMVLMK